LIWETAGIVGVAPWSFTLAELVRMCEAREISEWNRTVQLSVILANAWRDEKKRSEPFTAVDFHPYRDRLQLPERPKVDDVAEDLSILKYLFVDRGGSRG
jgi:hypothetical protein